MHILGELFSLLLTFLLKFLVLHASLHFGQAQNFHEGILDTVFIIISFPQILRFLGRYISVIRVEVKM